MRSTVRRTTDNAGGPDAYERPCHRRELVKAGQSSFSVSRTTSGLFVMMPSTPKPATRRVSSAVSTVQVEISSGLPCGPSSAWIAVT